MLRVAKSCPKIELEKYPRFNIYLSHNELIVLSFLKKILFCFIV